MELKGCLINEKRLTPLKSGITVTNAGNKPATQ